MARLPRLSAYLAAAAVVALFALTSVDAAPHRDRASHRGVSRKSRHHRTSVDAMVGTAPPSHLGHPVPAVVAPETPLLSAATAEHVDDHYIVVLRDDVPDTTLQAHMNWLSTFLVTSASISGVPGNANRIKHVYDFPGGVRGYAGRFDAHALDAIRRSEHVAYVERDQVVRIVGDFHGLDEDDKVEVQKDAPWGLSRISHRSKPSGARYKEYPFSEHAGANVTVYIIDTGINIAHVDFEGRARWGITVPENDEDKDGNGHGTHCAGTATGKKYGVAKKASAVAVKVLSSNGSGTMSDVIRGVEWAAQDHKRRAKKDANAKSVANMSLGGGASRTLDRAVNAAVDAGVHFAVAAGNDNRNACNYSPAAADKAVTVGATAIDDTMAWFSNYGKCVDVFAPGKDILSAWIGSKVATNTISGTSMASPHVAGLLAYLASQSETPIAPKVLKERVIALSTKDAITGIPKPSKGGKKKRPQLPPWFPPGDDDDEDAGVTPNRLVYTGIQYEETPEPPSDDNPPEEGDPEDGEGMYRVLPVLRRVGRDLVEADDEDGLPLAVIAWVAKAADAVRVRVRELVE